MGVLKVFDSFFVNESDGDSEGDIGRLFWAPVSYLEDPPRIIEAVRASSDEHRQALFKMRDLNEKHFQPSDELPVHSLAKRAGEELIGTTAKMRPVVVLAHASASDMDTLPRAEGRPAQKGAGRTTYLLAPFYSISSPQQPGTFGPEFVRRIRRLQYPHLFCVPDFQKEDGRPRSIIRLDRLFPWHLSKGSKPIGKRLHPEVLETVLSQLALLTGAESTEAFYMVQELAQESLP